MKHKLLSIIITVACLCSCNNLDVPEPGPENDHRGIEYIFDNDWEYVHDREIDVSELPNDFTLEFRVFGYTSISVNNTESESTATPLGPTETSEAGQIIGIPVYDRNSDSYRYLQKVRFETKGEKRIEITYSYGDFGYFGTSTFALVRK